jgi:Bacterial regulatory proteins, tetR family
MAAQIPDTPAPTIATWKPGGGLGGRFFRSAAKKRENIEVRQTKNRVAKKTTARSTALPLARPLEEDGTRERLKSAAMHLFSARGIDGVTVRDIVAEPLPLLGNYVGAKRTLDARAPNVRL